MIPGRIFVRKALRTDIWTYFALHKDAARATSKPKYSYTLCNEKLQKFHTHHTDLKISLYNDEDENNQIFASK